MQSMWIVYAIGASVVWGLSYVFSGQLFKHISVPTTIAIYSLAAAIVVGSFAYAKGYLSTDLVVIRSTHQVLVLLILATLTFVIAELLIGLSIDASNATLAGLIEISYPLFIALFAYLLFGEVHLNLGTAIGGMCILLGATLVYWFS